jgi:LmbE family N-acetylglucosaminyl deacetylase
MPEIKNEIYLLRSKVSRYRKLLIAGIILWIVFYLSGFFTGWWVVKGKLGSFPQVSSQTRLLVIAPHPDDETVMTGGLIQRVLENRGKVEIVYLTNGDGSRTTIIQEDKKIDLSPTEFIALGETRIEEASKAASILGVERKDVFFLGFPDQGLTKIYNRNFSQADGIGSSAMTKVDHVPYPGAYRPGQAYYGENLLNDVKEIALAFKPDIIVTGHPRDNHPDHRISFALIEKIRPEFGPDCKIYSSLTHFRGYPAPEGYLFPPKKLFGGDWLSLELYPPEIANKKKAIEVHVSQYSRPQDKLLLERFTSRNEIFEVE